MQGMCGRMVWGSLVLVLWLSTETFAGVFTATVESVSTNERTVTLKVAKKNTARTFEVKAAAVITIDNQAVSLEEIEPGQAVTVTTNGVDEVTKLVVRTDVPKPAKVDRASAVDKPPKAVQTSSDDTASATGDWPQFRGPDRDNVSHETGLLKEWPEGGPELAWKTTGLGDGYSSVAVSQGRLFTMGNRKKAEYLIALDVVSGEELWSLRTGDAYTNGTGDGPRGTPTVDGEQVYALGANGDLVCATVDKGKKVWHVNILKEFDGGNIVWGISESVLVDGDHVLCTPGGKKATFVALNKKTGKPVWRSTSSDRPQAAYSSMIAVEVGGVKQYVNYTHTAVVGIKAADGKLMWSSDKSVNGTANCSTPIFFEDSIFTASGYGTGGALVKLKSTGNSVTAKFAYDTKKMKNHHGGMAAVDGYLYGFDEDVLTCLELETGDVQWFDRSVGKGAVTIADGMLYLRSENGPVALAKVSTEGYTETGRFDQPDRSDKPSWSHPAVANGILYLRDMDALLAYNVKEAE